MIHRIEGFSKVEKDAYVNFAFVNARKPRIRYVQCSDVNVLCIFKNAC